MKSKTIITALIFFVMFIQSWSEQQKVDAVTLNEVDTYFLSLSKWQDISPTIKDDPGTAKGKTVINKEENTNALIRIIA